MTPSKRELVDVAAARQELLSELRSVHRRDRRQRMIAALACGARAGAVAFFGVMAIYGAWRILVFVFALEQLVLEPGAVALTGVLAFVAGVVLGPLAALGRRESLIATAERWDLAAGTQNRIATALELSRSLRCGPFEAAAIVDGMHALEAARLYAPAIPRVRRSLSQTAGILASGVAILVAASIIPLRQRSIDSRERLDAAAPETPAEVALGTPSTRPRTQTSEPRESVVPERDASTAREPSDEPIANRETGGTPPGEQQRSTGRPGRGKNVEAERARQASVAQGDPTEGASPSPLKDERRERETKPKKAADPTRHVRNLREKKEEEMGATAGQSGAGGGAMSPVRSAWSQRDRSSDDPLPENPTEEDIEDQVTEDEARGGTQPTLKDRRGATSRDLSISGPGEGGDGRGGPTPHKKSRGTASLVLGVPVPDFVRGTLNPGTTKVTHERVEPVPSDASPHEAVAIASRRRPEPIVHPEHMPSSLRSVLARFFVAFHGGSVEEAP